MKISNSTPNYINQTYANQANAANNTGQNPKAPLKSDENQTDSINLSKRTKDLQKISKAMETEPAERTKYVADIKHKVDTGQYNISAELVAEKMVGSFMDEMG